MSGVLSSGELQLMRQCQPVGHASGDQPHGDPSLHLRALYLTHSEIESHQWLHWPLLAVPVLSTEPGKEPRKKVGWQLTWS